MAKPSHRLSVFPFSEVGEREQQEDYFYTAPTNHDGKPWLGIVADGMGGHESGNVASMEGVHAIRKAFESDASGRGKARSIGRALSDATLKGHQAVMRAAEQAGALGNMGSTVVAFVIDGSTLYWCSAGDSRLYLFRAGRLTQLTRDFTVAEDMRHSPRRGEWTTAEIEGSARPDALTSFMGTDDWREHSGHRELEPGDVVVACTDGVYGTLGNDGIAETCKVSGGRTASEKIAEKMHQRVRDAKKSKQDNATAIVVRFEEANCKYSMTIPVTVIGVALAVGIGAKVWFGPDQQPTQIASRPTAPDSSPVAPGSPSTVAATSSGVTAGQSKPPPTTASSASTVVNAVVPPVAGSGVANSAATAQAAGPARPATAAPTKVAAEPTKGSKAAAADAKKTSDNRLTKKIAQTLAAFEKESPKGTIRPEDAMRSARELMAELNASTLADQAKYRASLVRMHDQALLSRLKWNLKGARKTESDRGPAEALKFLNQNVFSLQSDIAQLTAEFKAEATQKIDEANGYKLALQNKVDALPKVTPAEPPASAAGLAAGALQPDKPAATPPASGASSVTSRSPG